MDAWCASICCRCPAGGGLHGYYLVADCLAMGLPRFSAQPACGAAGDKLQPLHHECTCIVLNKMSMKKNVMHRAACGCPSRRRRVTCGPGLAHSSPRAATSTVPDARPDAAPRSRNGNPRLSEGQGRKGATPPSGAAVDLGLEFGSDGIRLLESASSPPPCAFFSRFHVLRAQAVAAPGTSQPSEVHVTSLSSVAPEAFRASHRLSFSDAESSFLEGGAAGPRNSAQRRRHCNRDRVFTARATSLNEIVSGSTSLQTGRPFLDLQFLNLLSSSAPQLPILNSLASEWGVPCVGSMPSRHEAR